MPYVADMDKLKLDEACRKTEVKVTLMDVEALWLPPIRTFLHIGAALAVLILITKQTTNRWPELEIIFAMARSSVHAVDGASASSRTLQSSTLEIPRRYESLLPDTPTAHERVA